MAARQSCQTAQPLRIRSRRAFDAKPGRRRPSPPQAASRFATVLQLPDSASSDLIAALSLTRADNAGHVYVADQQQDYSSLPVYRSAEDAGVTAESGGGGPN